MVGLQELGDHPAQREMDARYQEVFPWGKGWPPPQGAGNYADRMAAGQAGLEVERTIPDYEDGYARTAPVGQFEPNALGLYDLGGNVQEWVADPYGPESSYGVTRGGGWSSFQRSNLASQHRNVVHPQREGEFYGFRVVLVREELEVPLPVEGGELQRYVPERGMAEPRAGR